MTINSGKIASLRSEIAAIVQIAATAEALGLEVDPVAAIASGISPADFAALLMMDAAAAMKGDIASDVAAVLGHAMAGGNRKL